MEDGEGGGSGCWEVVRDVEEVELRKVERVEPVNVRLDSIEEEEEEKEEEEEEDDEDDEPVALRGTQVVPSPAVLLNISFAWPAAMSNSVF